MDNKIDLEGKFPIPSSERLHKPCCFFCTNFLCFAISSHYI